MECTGCTTWVQHMRRKGLLKAHLGWLDPSGRLPCSSWSHYFQLMPSSAASCGVQALGANC